MFVVMLPMLLIALIAFQIPSYLKTAVPKTGKVIDADSGDGVSDAVVFVKGLWHQNGLWQAPGPTCIYFDMLVTDAQGNFSVPSHYSRFEIGLPGRDSGHDWTIEVRKSGYISGDAELPLTFDASGAYNHPPIPWNSAYKDYQWNGLAIEIPPILLRQPDMTLEERIAMFEPRGTDPAFGCHFSTDDVHDYLSKARQSFYSQQEKVVCHSSQTATTNENTVFTIGEWARNRVGFRNTLKNAGLPFRAGRASSGFEYQLTDLCKAMQAGE